MVASEAAQAVTSTVLRGSQATEATVTALLAVAAWEVALAVMITPLPAAEGIVMALLVGNMRRVVVCHRSPFPNVIRCWNCTNDSR